MGDLAGNKKFQTSSHAIEKKLAASQIYYNPISKTLNT